MTKATIRWNQKSQKSELVFKGNVLVSSKNEGYLNYLVMKQKHSAITKNGITSVVITSRQPTTPLEVQDETGHALIKPEYPIEKRFDFMSQMISMVINKTRRSIIISGDGGIGKTHTVLKKLEAAGKVDYIKVLPSIETLALIKKEDSDFEMAEKARDFMNKAEEGDYIVIKGYVSAAALFRVMYEHKNRIIIFDDCDKVILDRTAIDLLKSALDTYEDRWVTWQVERMGDSDLPRSFKFEGSIIFITNTPLSKIDEAIKTRALKVDLSMTKEQRIHWMKDQLEGVLPEITDIQAKREALDLLDENKHLTQDVNFRTLMTLISIRTDPSVTNWRELGTYALTEQ